MPKVQTEKTMNEKLVGHPHPTKLRKSHEVCPSLHIRSTNIYPA